MAVAARALRLPCLGRTPRPLPGLHSPGSVAVPEPLGEALPAENPVDPGQGDCSGASEGG